MSELVSLQRVVADGYHNAFTDLTYWQGHYYLGYRHAQTHAVDPPGGRHHPALRGSDGLGAGSPI